MASREWFIYVVVAGDYRKIGITQDVKNRVSTLQTGNAEDISLETVFSVVNEESARLIERKCHDALKFADAHVGGGDTKSTEKAIRKVHGDEVFKHMKRAANANAKGDFDGEERHFERAQNAGRRTDRIGSTVGRGRSAFRKQWEEVQVNESGHQITPTVHTKNYTWGKMKTIHHGHDFSIPLHPEHHEAIAKLENDQEHKFKDETGRHWTAKRQGNDVHFDANGLKTTVSHQSMKESWIGRAHV